MWSGGFTMSPRKTNYNMKIDTKKLCSLIEEVKQERASSVLLTKPSAKLIKESSLSRVLQHIIEHDAALLSAFREDPRDSGPCADSAQIETDLDAASALSLNKRRNRDLKATLLTLGYGVTKIGGTYIEDFNTPEAVEVAEDSLFVVNLKDAPTFFRDIEDLGARFCQDSVLIVPKGGKGAHLLGTNNSEFPGLGEKIEVGDLKLGEEAEFMSRVNKRPFTFGEGLDTYKQLSRNSRMAAKTIAKKVLNARSSELKNK